jgi:hypothetical protein
MITFNVEIQGDSPLLCNRFTDATMEKIAKGSSTVTAAGHKGTPRERAEQTLYMGTNGRPMIPGPNVYRSIIDAGRFHKAGKEKITTQKSSLVPAGIWLIDIECALFNPDYDVPQWEVDSRRVVNPATGGAMMAYRARFDSWRLKFTLQVDDKMFDEHIVRLLVDDAGQKIGLGDFRPSRKGPFGRFKVIAWGKEHPARKAA